MNSLSKIKSSIIEQGKRIFKVVQFGVKTANEAAPFGDDSSPLENMTALYAETMENGEPVIIGYVNENQISEPGEKRIYSLKPDGSLSFYFHLKGDGTCEIGGNAHNAVRYAPLDTSLQQQTALINAELSKIAVVLNSLAPGSYTVAPVTINTTAARINEIKIL